MPDERQCLTHTPDEYRREIDFHLGKARELRRYLRVAISVEQQRNGPPPAHDAETDDVDDVPAVAPSPSPLTAPAANHRANKPTVGLPN